MCAVSRCQPLPRSLFLSISSDTSVRSAIPARKIYSRIVGGRGGANTRARPPPPAACFRLSAGRSRERWEGRQGQGEQTTQGHKHTRKATAGVESLALVFLGTAEASHPTLYCARRNKAAKINIYMYTSTSTPTIVITSLILSASRIPFSSGSWSLRHRGQKDTCLIVNLNGHLM